MQHEYAIFVSAVSPVSAMNTRGISATRNMKSKLAIKFPIPYVWWSNALPPAHEKASSYRGIPEGDVQASIWLLHNMAPRL